MKIYSAVCLAVVVLMAFMIAAPAFSQGNDQTAPAAAPETTQTAVNEESSAAKEMSIYGEVQAVNAAANSISVQYYDYDSDEEKTIEIVSGKDTKIENAAALDKINKGDWVDVTYVLSEGKNTAKSIIVEKEEAVAEPAPAQTPADQGPGTE